MGSKKRNKKKPYEFYSIWEGKRICIALSWAECEPLVSGFPNNGYQGAYTLMDAITLLRDGLNQRIKLHQRNDFIKPPDDDPNNDDLPF